MNELSSEDKKRLREEQEKRLQRKAKTVKVTPKQEEKAVEIPESPKPKRPVRRRPKNNYDSHFSVLNRFVDLHLNENLTATELKVWLFLFRHSHNGIVEVGYSRMQQALGREKNAISKAVNALIEKKLIERIIIGKPERGEYHSTLSKYRVL